MSLRRQLSEPARRRRVWLAPVALLALAPKCLLCAAAYAGLGTTLGLGGPELCGATDRTDGLPLFLGTLGVAGLFLYRIIHRSTPTHP